jgi:hypothetical protein
MIDFTSKDFRFISKEDEDPYWVPGTIVNCEVVYEDYLPNKEVKNFWGMFNGLTMVTYKGYDGELPREDSDTSGFDEFDIYYKDTLISDMTCIELELLIKSYERDNKIDKIL